MIALSQHCYVDGDTPLTGWVAQPVSAPRAAIAVFPSIMNITPRVAEKASALASAGFLVLVADYYGAPTGDFDHAQDQARKLRADNAQYRQRLTSALDALRAMPEATGLPMGAIGFCMGGQAVLELARAGVHLSVVASFHGLLNSDRPAQAGDTIQPRILVCHGDKDPLVPRDQVTAFMDEMDGAGANWHLHIYAGTKHGFTDPASDSRGMDAVAYDASADRQSWAAMLELCEEVFG